MLKKKEVILTLLALFGLVAESSAAGGSGISAGLGVGSGVSAGLASTESGASSSLEASTNSATFTDLGISTQSGASIALGTSTDVGIIVAATSSLTALGANSGVDIAASTATLGTSKVTIDAPAVEITGKVVPTQSLETTSMVTVGGPAIDATSSVSVGVPKLKLGADVDTSTSTGIAALIGSTDATANADISAGLDVHTLQANVGVASQVDGAADLGETLGTGDILPVHSKLAVTADAIPAVPEADTYAMLLAGLGLMGFMVKRRREAPN
ncbi:PEP-CTERM protein-sorting domain-containing protein [Nitrosospira multiformis ATCC 25196]|uniref:PEP-CTERM protein-sorting domain-containing protein n=1 Tax=Nitrosospira multiformis (strain ATCC 25196 / NCIMB 11849 / C 71) TaxID=323848 RepID=Q2Y8B0_NITMU|nr:PEP-CTERM sorting domain-containing protein [Nitrosospira multiformis]ABB75011.1 hypothetical protein Nmul_A1713 [Nitrosospira multiformis ATCC 25196]SEF84681.1 PEP-CTERM protein-sorting domain-containing protein [Nitrosospira multiformis ATCC 25196]